MLPCLNKIYAVALTYKKKGARTENISEQKMIILATMKCYFKHERHKILFFHNLLLQHLSIKFNHDNLYLRWKGHDLIFPFQGKLEISRSILKGEWGLIKNQIKGWPNFKGRLKN